MSVFSTSMFERGLPGLGTGGRLFGFRVLEDNLAWGLMDGEGRVLLVDVPEAEPVIEGVAALGGQVDTVLVTHGHADHVQGLPALRRGCSAEVWAAEGIRIAGARVLPADGGRMTWRGLEIRVLDTSGHSDCDTSFYFPALGVCFCGDTLFDGGCGRLFAGPPERMWASLCRLRALPDDTLLCFGHDYAVENYRFAVKTFPGMPVFGERLAAVRDAVRSGAGCGPVTVGEQSRWNPMLMADHREIARALGMEGAAAAEVFAEIRSRRSAF